MRQPDIAREVERLIDRARAGSSYFAEVRAESEAARLEYLCVRAETVELTADLNDARDRIEKTRRANL